MAITVTGWNGTGSPGPCSGRISYQAGDTLYGLSTGVPDSGTILRAVYDFLVARGWSAVSFVSGTPAAGLCAMQAPNMLDSNNNISYKYIMFDAVTTSGQFYMRSYESITNTGTLTNLSYLSNTATYAQRIGTVDVNRQINAGQDGYILISASAQHVAMHGFCSGSGFGTAVDGGFLFVSELNRPSIYDLASNGYPRHVWCTSYQLFNSTTANSFSVSIPRNRAGSTSSALSRIIGGQGSTLSTLQNFYLSYPATTTAISGRPEASPMIVREVDDAQYRTGACGSIMNVYLITRTFGQPIGQDIMVPVKSYGSVETPQLIGGSKFTGQKLYDPINGTMEPYWLMGQIPLTSTAIGFGRIAVPK